MSVQDRREIETYEELAGWYDAKYSEMKGTWVTPEQECDWHLDDIGVPEDNREHHRLLDIGCGGGDFLVAATFRELDCLGIEISKYALDVAKKRLAHTGARLALANIETLADGKPGDQFDYIVSLGSLEHVLDIDKALRSIHKLLKPTGKFYFYLPNEKWIHKDQPNERTGTQAAWINLLTKHGFEVQSVKRWNDSDAYMGTVIKGASLHELLDPDFDLGKGIRNRLNEMHKPLYINLGSGQRPFQKPWVNVDCQAKWNPDIIADGGDLKAHFADNTADMIVLHHVLEHFGCGEADGMLKECHRILKPGGSLIVTVPDVAELAHEYMEGHRLTTQLYLTNLYGAYMGDEADRHKWGYDWDSLSLTLHNAGLTRQKAFDYRPIPGADIARDWWILGMEAVK